MDGPTFHERLRILLHDKGLGYVIPHPFWTADDLKRRAQSALDTLYTTIIERSQLEGKPSIAISGMIRTCTATAGSAVPTDFHQLIMGRSATGMYVNADPIAISASDVGYDVVWASGGTFKGTATTAYYYAKPTGPVDPQAVDFHTFTDGFFDTVITLTAIETVMSEQQDAADRLDVLYEIFQDQMETLE